MEAVAQKLPPCHGPLKARSGRLVWVKPVLRAVPIYAMMAENLPPWARKRNRCHMQEVLLRKLGRIGTRKMHGGLAVSLQANDARWLGVSDPKLAGYAL